MALYDTSYEKYFGNRLTQLTNETTEDEIANVYDKWATEYDKDVLHGAGVAYHKPLAKSLDAAIKQAFPDQKQSQVKIIDAGAGTGLAGVELSKLGYTKIDAIDISQEMLNEAKKTKAYTKFICAPLNEQRNPEIETGEYHGLICTGTLVPAHVRPEALEEMIRMVKTGGLFSFTMRNQDVKQYEDKLLELEKTGKWKIFSKETMPYFGDRDLPKEVNGFIYKVLKN